MKRILMLLTSLSLLTACLEEGITIVIPSPGDAEVTTPNDPVTPEIPTEPVNPDIPREPLVLQENESGFCGLIGEIEAEHLGFTGIGYANTTNIKGASITWAVRAPQAGDYAVRVRFADGGASARPGIFNLNHVATNSVGFSTTQAWTDYQLTQWIPLYLNEGHNTITLTATHDLGLPNIDSLNFDSADLLPSYCDDSDNDTTPPNDEPPKDETPPNENLTWLNACRELVENSDINWRESALLKTDQEIVHCLHSSLGQPIGFGENSTGGFDSNGNSKLVVINRDAAVSPEQQLFEAISSTDHHWVVFDKQDFTEPTDISFHRLYCADAKVRAALGNASIEECLNPLLWCVNNAIASESCLNEFYNRRLNDSDLPIRNRMIHSNTTVDGRGSRAFMLFNGFSIGSDANGKSTHASSNIIITNMEFRGAGHVEDHNLDPDMIRSTGESHDIWIHQNTFDNTGDSAWDIKVGAYNITLSFNKLINVKRAGLMGSSDSRTINEQITTTMHNNLFVTHDEYYSDKRYEAMRRVPLLRRGQAHLFNNVFYGYRKDILSIRVGGRLLFENNTVLNNAEQAQYKKDSLNYFLQYLLRDFREGGLNVTGSMVWLADSNCRAIGEPVDLTSSQGTTPSMVAQYSERSQLTFHTNRMAAGEDLANYVFATAGKGGLTPYLSKFAEPTYSVVQQAPETCQSPSFAN